MPIPMHICGVAWCAAYALILWRGQRDKTYGMPLPALAMNLAWELFDAALAARPIMGAYSVAWLCLDLLMLLQASRNAPKEHPGLTPMRFWFGVGGGATVWLAALVVSEKLHSRLLPSAFVQNIAVSALFVWMILRRKSVRGQSLYIGIAKMVGTGVIALSFAVRELPRGGLDTRALELAPILLLDALYLVLYVRCARRLKINPFWRPAMRTRVEL